MNQSNNKDRRDCIKNCESAYDACMQSREHESVCQMKNNQCACGCKIA